MLRTTLVLATAASAYAVYFDLAILQRMSDQRFTTMEACYPSGGAEWVNGTCWLDTEWKAVAVAGLAAVQDFNARDGSYVPAFADLAGSCDKQLHVSVLDSGSTPLVSARELAAALFDVSPPHALVGPSRSVAAKTTANFGGAFVCPCGSSHRRLPRQQLGASLPAHTRALSRATAAQDLLQVSYWATSTDLDYTPDYPRFARTIPTDEVTARAARPKWPPWEEHSSPALPPGMATPACPLLCTPRRSR